MGRDRSSGVIVVIVILFIVAFWFIGLFINRMAGESQQKNKDISVSEAIAKADDYNFHIYWIGDCPSELQKLGDKISVLEPSKVNKDNMPIVWADVPYKIYNTDGVVIYEVEPRDYADFMLIVVRSDVTLTDEQLEILRNCVVENNVSMIVMGKNINEYRRIMLLSAGVYDDTDSVLYSPVFEDRDNPIDPSLINDDAAFTKAVLDILYEISDKQQEEWYIAAHGTSNTESEEVSSETELIEESAGE